MEQEGAKEVKATMDTRAYRAEGTKRDLSWAECSLEQKIERLRQEAAQLRGAIDVLREIAYGALQIAREHDHLHGRVVQEARLISGSNIPSLRGAYDQLK